MILATIIGNLGRDAEVKPINDEQYLSFSVASTEKRNSEEATTWVSVLYPYQESLLPYLKKGQQVFVQGRLKAGIYQSQNTFGIDLSVFAQTLQLCGSKKEESAPAPAAVPTASAEGQSTPPPEDENGNPKEPNDLPF
jgi:single-stranded DNA-binding protein